MPLSLDLVQALDGQFSAWAQSSLSGTKKRPAAAVELAASKKSRPAETLAVRHDATALLQDADLSHLADSTDIHDTVIMRHAGVLGLSSLVGACPYSVPDWLPAVLVKLAMHISDPMPIKGTVKRCMSEFWRTHQDMWPVFKLQFDEYQLATLTELLVSPSYYA